MFKKATKEKAKSRLALQGPAGSGKTRTALEIATNLGSKVALVDTEFGSASKYSDKFDFDVEEIRDDYNPKRVPEIIAQAAAAGYDVLIFDSMTHFWNGPGGFLELVDAEVKKMSARGGRPDSFAAWKAVDPLYKRMVLALLSAPMHIIVTLRAKTSYERTEDDKGRTKIQKMGLAPEIRDSFQYEMDIEGMLDVEHNLVVGKTRCDALDGKVFNKPGKDVADIILAWLEDGAETVPAPPSLPLGEPEVSPKRAKMLAKIGEMELAVGPAAANDVYVRVIGTDVSRDDLDDAWLEKYGLALKAKSAEVTQAAA